MVRTDKDIIEDKNVLSLIQKYYNIDDDLFEQIVGIITMDKECFDKPINAENVAKVCRNCIIQIVKDLMKNIPQSDFNKFNDIYEEGLKEKYENI